MLWLMNLFWSALLIGSVVKKIRGAKEYAADWEEEVKVNPRGNLDVADQEPVTRRRSSANIEGSPSKEDTKHR